jgi:ketosteroid isomerase-like protein
VTPLSVRDRVSNLAGRYCAAVLSGDVKEFADCWADDARWAVPGGHEYESRTRITSVFEKVRVPFRLCVQELLSGVVEPHGPDHASAVWQIREMQWRTDDTQTFVIGTYSDECARDADGIWRFTRRQFDEVVRGTF